MSAHTPGPWELLPLDRDKKYYGTLVKIGNDQLEIWTPGNFGTLRPSAREIANGWEDGYPYDHMESEECLANARLIAAAPDLFREAKFVFDRDLTIVGNEVHIRFDSHADACTAVAGNRAALKKAEGGE